MSYLNVAEVEQAVANLASDHPALCELITLPHLSVEGRTCHALRLGGGAPGSRDCVMVIGGQHANEWGSCEIILNLAVELITAFETNTGRAYGGKVFSASQIQQIMDGLHVILFPLVNPDGRKFSQDNIASNAPVPAWRRNRNPAYGNKSFNCIGVDLNRNYDFMFDFKRLFADLGLVGWLDNPCKDIFQGPSPFSEPESKNVKWLLDTNPRTRWFVDLHSGSQNIRVNWGDDQAQSTDPAMNFQNPMFDKKRGVKNDAYKEYVPPDDLLVEATLAKGMHDAIFAVRGFDFPAAQDFTFTGAIPGTSKDYAYSRHFVDPSKGKIYGFTIEWGDFHPLWPEMQLIIKDVTAGLIELCSQAPWVGPPTWAHNLPSAAAGSVPVAPGTSPTSWYTTPEDVQHIAYVGIDGLIHELFYFIGGDGAWHHNLPGAAAGSVPVAPGTSPTSWYTTPENVQHIAYVGIDGLIHELFYFVGGGGAWNHNVPSAAAGSVRVGGWTSPTSWYTTPENVQHIAYVGVDGLIHELFYFIGGDGAWHHNLPGAAAGSLPVMPGTSPTSWYTTPENVQHIAYVGIDGLIHELFYFIGGDGIWRHNLPSAAAGSVPVMPATSPTSWYTTPENVQHIAYVGDDLLIHELFYRIG